MIKLSNLSARIWLQRAKTLESMRNYEEAISSANKSLEFSHPEDQNFKEAQSLKESLIEDLGFQYLESGREKGSEKKLWGSY